MKTIIDIKNYHKAIEAFNFKEVSAIMTLLNWTWQGNKEAPTEFDIRVKVENLTIAALNGLDSRDSSYASSGGIKVLVKRSSDEIEIQISFVAVRSGFL